MKIYFNRKKINFNFRKPITVLELLNNLNLVKEEVLVFVNKKLVSEKEKLNKEDNVLIKQIVFTD